MSASMWDWTAEELLRRASSADPTPGGGAIAAVTAAFGLSLVRMAIDVTVAAAAASTAAVPAPAATAPAAPAAAAPADDLARLGEAQQRVTALQARAVASADHDVLEFEALMAGYRMPRESEAERAARSRVIEEATVTATRGPLDLAEAAIEAIALVDAVEPLIKPTIVSDAQAGRDLLRGAALAALRTADINLAALEQRGYHATQALRQRRDAVQRAAGDVQPDAGGAEHAAGEAEHAAARERG